MESIAQILLAVPRRNEMFQVYPICNANEENENSTEPSIYDCGCKLEREQWYGLLFDIGALRVNKNGNVSPVNGLSALSTDHGSFLTSYNVDVKVHTFRLKGEYTYKVTVNNRNGNEEDYDYKLPTQKTLSLIARRLKAATICQQGPQVLQKKRTITPSTDVNKKRKGDETIFIKFTIGADIQRTINGIILPSRNKLDMETGKTSRKSREVKYEIQKEEYKLPIEYVPIRKVDLQLLTDELESMRELLSELQNEKDELSAQLEAAQLEHVKIQEEYEFTIVALERKKEELQVKIENNKNVCEIGMKMMSISEMTQVKTTIAGAHLYNHSLGIMPRTSIESLSMGTPILVAAFLATLGITDLLEDPADIANACPSVSTLHKYLGMAREDALMSNACSFYSS